MAINSSNSANTTTTAPSAVGTADLNTSNVSSASNINNTATTLEDDLGAEGKKAGQDSNNTMNKGVTYPIIRINDNYLSENEIEYFELETGYYKNYKEYLYHHKITKGFLPTMKLIVETKNPNMTKSEIVKCGDKCAVFIGSGHGIIRSLRCDFTITKCTSWDNNLERNDVQRYSIEGELSIPNLRTQKEHFSFSGSSRDAIMDAAKKLGLSFMFCDPENTDDYMIWHCTSNLEDYVKQVYMHAWKNFNSFFDCWIDPHYGVSFLNINKLLLEDGLDEKIDAAIYNNYLNSTRGVDGKNTNMTDKQASANATPQYKLLTNIGEDKESLTSFYVISYKINNRASAIQHAIGLNCKLNYVTDNPGCTDNATGIEMQYSMPLNETKLKNGFYVLVGPGKNLTYKAGDDEAGSSYVEKTTVVQGGQISDIMSSADGDSIKQSGGNTQASGNTHKFYDVAYEHNVRNNLQLQKQIVDMTCAGANLQVVRGDKIPALIIDKNRLLTAAISGTINQELAYNINETVSGWFIIDGIRYTWHRREGSPSGGLTCWQTDLKLTRREWPIPGGTYGETDDSGNLVQTVNTAKGQSVESTNVNKVSVEEEQNNNLTESMTASGLKVAQDDTSDADKSTDEAAITILKNTLGTSDISMVNGEATIGNNSAGGNNTGTTYVGTLSTNANSTGTTSSTKSQATTSTSDIPLTGLKDFMKAIYQALLIEAKGKFKLVSAKRWAVDTDGQKVEGNAFVKKYGYYKCINALGETMYFKSNNSKHLYGEAIDIINAGGQDFTTLMTEIIMQSSLILSLMYLYGVSAYIEEALDDAGTSTKHYHLGTDTIKQEEFWASVKAILGDTMLPMSNIDFSDYATHNSLTTEITHEDVSEEDAEGTQSKSEQ